MRPGPARPGPARRQRITSGSSHLFSWWLLLNQRTGVLFCSLFIDSLQDIHVKKGPNISIP